MSRISTYSTLCPTCKVAGVDRQLGFDDEQGSICCDATEPHFFETMPDEPAPSVEGSGFAPETQTGPIPTAEADTAKFSELIGKRKQAEVEPVRMPVIPAEVFDVVKQVEEASEDLTGARTLDDLPPTAGSLSVAGMVPEGGAVRLRSGDLLLGVVVPEQWVQAVMSEAEAQGCKSPAEYVGRWLASEEMRAVFADALTNYWSNQQAPV